jgi:antitoxin HicB
MLEAIDCLGSDLSIRMQQKEEIPAPSAAKRGHRLVPVPLWLAPSLALYVAMRERRVSNSELARRLGCSETVVRRMLDPEHHTKPEKLQAALDVLGKRIAISVEDAA